jgi:hypothetical protein
MSATRLALLLLLFTLAPRLSSAAEAPKPKKIVFIAGPKSHGPEGNRIHDYPWSAKLLKAMFEKSNVQKQIASVVVRDGWPADESVLADADAVMVISDGRDGDLFQEAPFLESPERVAAVQKLIDMRRRCWTGPVATLTGKRTARRSGTRRLKPKTPTCCL